MRNGTLVGGPARGSSDLLARGRAEEGHQLSRHLCTPPSVGDVVEVSIRPVAATVRIGTCSWADDALSKHYYPKGLPAGERLAYYAQEFDTVEVDSTFYRLRFEEMVSRWAERTPPGFTMHVKAFGIMTRHPVRLEQLPPELRDDVPTDDRGRVERPSR